jgi:hypothetical protein
MKKTILIAAVMFFSLSVAAYAQATFFIGSTPVTSVTASGNAERTGDLSFTIMSGFGTSIDGSFSINYGVPITVGFASIHVTGAGFIHVNEVSSNLREGLLVLDVDPLATSGSVILSGVRVQISGSNLTTLYADITSTGNLIFNAGQPIKVISAISPGLSGMAPFGLVASINAVAPDAEYQTTVKVTEGHFNAFGVTTDTDDTQTNSTWVKLTLSALPPKGVTITFPTLASTTFTGGGVTDAFKSIDGTTGADKTYAITSTSTSLDVYYALATDTATTVTESLQLPITITVNTAIATLPLPAGSVSMTATLAPLKPAFTATGGLPTEIPRYDVASVGPADIYTIIPGTTTLLIPFATTDQGFDTGIGIVNTTTDPGIAKMGFKGAIKQSGTMTFYFYPQTGAAIDPYTTGTLASGGTYAALLSEILNAAGADPVVTDFGSFANGAQALVIPKERTATPESVGQ